MGRDQGHRERAWPAYGLRGGELPQSRRVLGQEARHLHDHGRHLHARLFVLQRQDRQAECARWRRTGQDRRFRRQARVEPCRDHLRRSRRSRRRRRAAFRAGDRGYPRVIAGDDHRNPDARLPAQGRRARSRRRGPARRLQPQSRNRAVELSDGAARRALFPLDPAVAAGEGAGSVDLHQIRHHGRPRRNAERSAAIDGRSAFGGRRFPHHRPISPADEEASFGDEFRHAGRIQGLRDGGLFERLPAGFGDAADAGEDFAKLKAARFEKLGR